MSILHLFCTYFALILHYFTCLVTVYCNTQEKWQTTYSSNLRVNSETKKSMKRTKLNLKIHCISIHNVDWLIIFEKTLLHRSQQLKTIQLQTVILKFLYSTQCSPQLCGIMMTILFIFECFMKCKYCKYRSGSYKVSSF